MKEFYIDSDGIRLHAKLDQAEGVDKGPLCILIHGFTGNMEEEHIVAAQKAMNQAGVSVLRAEMYGHGKSGGEFRNHTLYKWVANALDVVHYAESMESVTELCLCGHSQGGLLAMLIAGMCPDRFRKLILMSPAWMIPECCRKGSILGISADPVNIPDSIKADEWELSGDYIRVAQTIHVEDEIKRYEGPVFIIHGDEDETVPFDYAKEALRLYRRAELFPIRGADHCFSGHMGEMADAVRTALQAE